MVGKMVGEAERRVWYDLSHRQSYLIGIHLCSCKLY